MVSETLQSQTKNVCVIGAGPSGLVAARELRKEGHRVVLLEQNHDVGGQWLYESNVEGEAGETSKLTLYYVLGVGSTTIIIQSFPLFLVQFYQLASEIRSWSAK